jgi:hypothetical protein
MSLEAFIDIRFGDPVISLSLNAQGLVYGSMMGRILYYQFKTHEERVINELSDEFISGAYLSHDNVLYACIGDLKSLVITNPDADRFHKRYVMFEKIHTSISCELSQIRMHKDTVFLGILEPNSSSDSLTHTVSPIHIIELSTETQRSIEGVRFPPYSVMFDFDGARLLWLEFGQNNKTLNLYRVGGEVTQVKSIGKNFGKVGLCKLMGESIVFVHKQRVIRRMDEEGKDRGEIGRHKDYIIALACVRIVKVERNRRMQRIEGRVDEARVENSDIDLREPEVKDGKMFVISADFRGHIKVWDEESLVEEISIGILPQLTEKYRKMQYFSMGYPYVINAYGPRIAISTDLGVLVIRSRALELHSQLIR